PDGKSLAASVAGKGGALIVWDAASGKERWRSEERCGTGGGPVAYSPDGKGVAAGFGPQGARIVTFEALTGKLVCGAWAGQKTATPSLAYSADGKLLASFDVRGGYVDLLDSDGKTAQPERWWRTGGPATALAFLPEGTRVAAADGSPFVRVLDIPTGKETHV